VPKFANGDDPVVSLPNPEAEKALEDICGTILVEEALEFAASSVASGKSVVDEEFCVALLEVQSARRICNCWREITYRYLPR
jgi:hypothetical protein